MNTLFTEGTKALNVAAEGTQNSLSARLKYAMQLAGVATVKTAQNGLAGIR